MKFDLNHTLPSDDTSNPETFGNASPPLVVGPYPSYKMGPMESMLIVLLFLLWFYALRRIYVVWSNVLNFSAIQSDSLGPRAAIGWDAFFHWAMEHFRGIRNSATGNGSENDANSYHNQPDFEASFSAKSAGANDVKSLKSNSPSQQVLILSDLNTAQVTRTVPVGGSKITSEV